MKILVVDDSKTCRRLYCRELQGGGYDVVEARDGIEALHIVQESEVDLVVLDIEMPHMNGYEVCERLRDKEFITRLGHKEGVLPVIFVTSNDSVEGRVKGFSKGADGYIHKGFRPGTLLENVNRILHPKNPLAGLRALVIEESRVVRTLIERALSEQDVTVVEAESCERAFEMLMLRGDAYDMVITALEMPGMRGDRLCKHVRSDLGRRTLPMLVLTESEDRRMLLGLFEAGASDYLVKPFEKEELTARLKASVEMVDTLRRGDAERAPAKEADEWSDARRALDQAQLATTVLHNVGNVLNSVFASCYQLSGIIKDSRLRQLLMSHRLLQEHEGDLSRFFAEDPRGKLLPEYMMRSGERLEDDHRNMAREIEEMVTKINLMKELIESQQLHAKLSTVEPSRMDDIIEDALKVQQDYLARHGVRLECDLGATAPVRVRRVPLTHVLINLLKNAVEAMAGVDAPTLKLTLAGEGKEVVLTVQDNGHGISEANLARIFTHGFTTKEAGHGFGLAFCAKAVADMNGRLEVRSEEGVGTEFLMFFPAEPV